MIPWAHRSLKPKPYLDCFNRLAQLTVQCPCTLQWTVPSPSTLPVPRESELPSNTWFLRPTPVLNSNGISIGLAVFAGLTTVTDRPRDHAIRSVTIGRIYEGLYVVCLRRCSLKIHNSSFNTVDSASNIGIIFNEFLASLSQAGAIGRPSYFFFQRVVPS